MLIDITQIGIDDDTLGSQLTMILGIFQGVEGHKLVRHDTSAAIDDASFLGAVSSRVGEVDTVCRVELAMLKALLQILSVGIALTQGANDATYNWIYHQCCCTG